MLKKSFFMLLCLALVLTCFAACGDTTTDHKHTYSTDWSSNETSHWYAASCEHTDLKANIGAHVDAENDGVCDICGHGGDHTHTYESTWTSDAEKHWHASSCGHTVKGDEAAHVDANKDGVCEVCEHGKDHIHTYGSTWTTDKDNHWYAPTCGHEVEVKDKAAHTDANNDGACDICKYDGGHTHTFETTWSIDGSKHWYAPTCGHDVTKDEAAHVDANNDGACDICKDNGGHKHAYSDKWSYDASAHWNAPSCGHTIAGINKAAHADNDGDKACDTCGYTNHSHTFNLSTWVFDATNHWHAATCGCAVKNGEAAHVDANEDGKCDVCPFVESLEAALAIGSSEASKNMVAGGTYFREGPNSASKVTYVYGTDYVYLKNDSRYNEYDDKDNLIGHYWETYSEEWYTLIDGELVALQDNYMGFHKNDWPEMAYLDGPYLSGLCQYAVSGYGVENTLLALYDYGVASVYGIVESGFNYDTKTWSFTFYHLSTYEDWTGETVVSAFGKITVTFTVDADNVIDYVTINERYYDNYAQNEDGIYVGTEGENDNVYTATINQVLGGRVTSFPFDMNEFNFTDVTFTDSEGNKLGDKIETVLGVSNYFTATEFAPDSANALIDVPEIILKDAEGNELGEWNEYISASFTSETMDLLIRVKVEGTYTVEFKTAKFSKTVTVTAVAPEPTYITPMIAGNYELISVDTVTAYVGMPYYFTAGVDEFADASFTAMLSRMDMMVCTLEEADFEVGYETYAGYSFVASQVGVYSVLLTSAVNPELTAVLTIEVVEPPKVSDLLNGSWSSTGYDNATLTFVPAAEGATNGTLTYEASSMWAGTVLATFDYEYDAEANVVNLTLTNDAFVYVDQLVFESDFSISTYYNGWAQGNFIKDEDEVESDIDYSVVDGEWVEYGENMFTMTFDAENKTGTFVVGDSVYAFTFVLSARDDGSYIIEFTEDAANHVNVEAGANIFDADYANGSNPWGANSFWNVWDGEILVVIANPMTGTPHECWLR